MKEEERIRLIELGKREASLHDAGYTFIAGLDEAGRGPLAGPVVAAAVILAPDTLIEGLNDSKKVSPKRRLVIESEIKERALAWALGEASPEEIDTYNILHATKMAMMRAIEGLGISPDYLLLDAILLPLDHQQESVIKGDEKIACIAAASILAKTARDRQMENVDAQYPAYGFRQHKGYPTAMHRQVVLEVGPCPIHRKSFLGFVEKSKKGR